MYETRDLGIQRPPWHTLLFEGQVAVDVRVVCPQDVENMLLKQARMGALEEMSTQTQVSGVERRNVAWNQFRHCCEGRAANRGQMSTAMRKKLVVEGGWVHERTVRRWVV